MRGPWTAVRSLICMTGFLALWGWIALSLRRFDAPLGLTLPPVARPAGVVLIVLGGILGLVCVGTFVILGRGTPAPFDPPAEFVARGPYRFVRNPMYIGGLSLLMGLGLLEKSGAIVLLGLLLSFLVHLGVVCLEEPDLERRFGESYREYKNTVNRWIPKRP
jgi:protein-S-isoprenylcysteine O-methyltransferase Ste14